MAEKVGDVKHALPTSSLIEFLSDPDNLLPGMPFVVGLVGRRVKLLFKRFFFKFQDIYSIEARREGEEEVSLELEGDKSRIRVLYRVYPSNVIVFAEYDGPRRRIAWPRVKELALSIAKYAVEHAGRVAGAEGEAGGRDYSEKLADLSWVTSLLMKSMLVKSMDVALLRGEFGRFIEDLMHEGLLRKYRLVYVSGSGNGSFRLLFIDGRLVGVYAAFGGREVVGDASKLNELEGYYKVKIYASVSPKLEVKG